MPKVHCVLRVEASYGIGGTYYVVMDCLFGTLLYESRLNGIDKNSKLALFLEVAKKLNDLHQLGIRHNDFFSENMMVLSSGKVQFIDFDMAVFVEGGQLTSDLRGMKNLMLSNHKEDC